MRRDLVWVERSESSPPARPALAEQPARPAQPVDTARIEAGGPNDWLTYHGSYKVLSLQPRSTRSTRAT